MLLLCEYVLRSCWEAVPKSCSGADTFARDPRSGDCVRGRQHRVICDSTCTEALARRRVRRRAGMRVPTLQTNSRVVPSATGRQTCDLERNVCAFLSKSVGFDTQLLKP